MYASTASITVGSLEVIAWATLRLSSSLLAAGIVLIAIGLGYGVWCLVSSWRKHWVVRVGPDALIVVRGSRQRELPWSEIEKVDVAKGRVEIIDHHGKRREVLPFDRNSQAHANLKDMLQAIQERRTGSAHP